MDAPQIARYSKEDALDYEFFTTEKYGGHRADNPQYN